MVAHQTRTGDLAVPPWPLVVTSLAEHAVGKQLILAGIVPYIRTVEISELAVRGWTYQVGLLQHLREHPEFCEGVLHQLHQDVGEDRTEFRCFRGAFGKGSLQLVIDRSTGKFYADLDHWNPYEDVVNWVGHAGEVLGGWWRRIRG